MYLPTDPVEQAPAPKPTVRDHLWVWGMALGFVALTAAAWQIPYAWIRWPAVIVSGFLTISAFVVVYAMLSNGAEEGA